MTVRYGSAPVSPMKTVRRYWKRGLLQNRSYRSIALRLLLLMSRSKVPLNKLLWQSALVSFEPQANHKQAERTGIDEIDLQFGVRYLQGEIRRVGRHRMTHSRYAHLVLPY